MRWTAVFLKRLIKRAIEHIMCDRIQAVCYNVTRWEPENGICDLNFASCIMRTYAEDHCREFDDDLELAYYKCLSGATRCTNKREMISECEKEYLVQIKRIIKTIDQQRGLISDSQYEQKKIKGTLEILEFNPFG
uniref:CHCH domain-containing protein n=1 Tax=Setaria digitata TaxID=48799 RepID=A0A915PKX3_9BILA